jgi:hypothetical protein
LITGKIDGSSAYVKTMFPFCNDWWQKPQVVSMPQFANCIKCMNVDSEREDSKEMRKEKDLLDINDAVGFFHDPRDRKF